MKRERETLTGRIEVEVKLTHTHIHFNTYKQTHIHTQATFILTEKRNSTRSDALKIEQKWKRKIKLNTP